MVFFLISYISSRPSDHHLPGISTTRILNAIARKLSVVKVNDLTRNLRSSSNGRLSVGLAVIMYTYYILYGKNELLSSKLGPFQFISVIHVQGDSPFFLSFIQHKFWFFFPPFICSLKRPRGLCQWLSQVSCREFMWSIYLCAYHYLHVVYCRWLSI